MIRYCGKCVLPDSRPHLDLDDDGVCTACRTHAEKPEVDWASRRIEFQRLCDQVRALRRDYDCVIPVSGGKDSTWQVAQCLEFGLKPLAVTWRAPGRTAIGQRNLDNLVNLGLDHIDFSINPEVERRFMLRTFENAGSTAIPMHLAIFSIPLRIATTFGIPLVVYGENSASEYGGALEDARSERLDAKWVHRYGVTQGTVAANWIGEGLSAQDLIPYSAPLPEEMELSGTKAVFLGHFFAWDPELTRDAAIASGFEIDGNGPRTGFFDYADIDDDFISLHHWIKWYKFGFTRTYDNLALEIRNGRITRDQAVSVIRQRGDETPVDDIRRFSMYSGLPIHRIMSIAETFRNESVWSRGTDNVWKIPGFLIEDWQWL